MLRNREIMLATAGAASYCTVLYGLNTHLVLYMRDVHFLSPVAAGSFLAVALVGGAIGRIAWGIISDRVFGGRRKQPMVIAGILSSVIALVTALMPGGSGTILLTVLVAIFGLGAVGWAPLGAAIIAEFAGAEKTGIAMGFSATIQGVGVFIGPLLFGLTVDHTGSYSLAWISLAVLAALGAASVGLVREGQSEIDARQMKALPVHR